MLKKVWSTPPLRTPQTRKCRMRTPIVMREGQGWVKDGPERIAVSGLVALCDDGSTWIMVHGEWVEMGPIPGSTRGTELGVEAKTAL